MDNIFQFLQETTKENFTAAQAMVTGHEDYDPYSKDLNIMEKLLDEDKYEEVARYDNVNVLLSPRAHLYKNYAWRQLEKEHEAKCEMVFAQKIMEGIHLTGDGTKEVPYQVIRISDERDMLMFLQEKFVKQSLIKGEDDEQFFDKIDCESGKEIYFDITTLYHKMQTMFRQE